MAQFVRIGDTLINLDLVTQMYIGSNYVNVQFGADNYITIRNPEEVAQVQKFMDAQPALLFYARVPGEGQVAELVDYDPDDPFLSAPDDTYTIDTSEHPISCPCWKCEERRAAK